MRKLLTAMAAVSAVALAAPVAAQYSSQANVNANARGSAGISNRIARLDARIQTGVRAGTIDRTEARTLRQQLREITRLERQYGRNGLTQQERSDLQARVRTFRDQLALADGRGSGQYGQASDPYYGQGGPYEEVQCESSGGGGLGGIIDSVFGGGSNDDCDGLRVGERVSGSLSSLPSQYRNQFRDGNGIVYRTDGQQIYQIDTRTNTVLRVYAMTR
jgi:hypothetical protein